LISRRRLYQIAALTALLAAAALFWYPRLPGDDKILAADLDGITEDYRRIIVLVEGADALDDATHERCLSAGRILFWHKQQAVREIAPKLAGNPAGIAQLVRYLSSNSALHDADKLAFLDLVDELDTGSGPLKAVHDNLESIQLTYREEVTRIFAQFATRGASGGREKWEVYVAGLRSRLSRDKLLAEFGDAVPEEPPAETMRGAAAPNPEVFGDDFAPKTVALTFDDGPHPKYTEQILALLNKYGIRACFFELGENLGTIDAAGKIKQARTWDVARRVLDAGHVIANHSYSHPVLSKLAPAARNQEIDSTSLLLEKLAGRKPLLFRAPYGARNPAILQQVTSDGLRSVMWNIDSLDWADPIPESIAMRVLHELNKRQKGIILFHDIHKQGVLALSPVIEELRRQNYTFLTFDQGKFAPSTPPAGSARSADVQVAATGVLGATAGTTSDRKLYRESWAVIIGINEYLHWPKLKYAVNDANGVEEALISHFGFKRENIRKLVNGEATRQRIMEVLGEELTDSKKVQREDRVFFFFAGHGATRTFEDNRQLGFIVPVDADPANSYSTAISMTSLREASDLIPAKHVYFVMDSCYSGLALTRGAGTFSKDQSYLEEITHRMARQILTAGGGDQQVADDGPNGHSVFTWALLEGLEGKADLDGNGFITASELGAYVSPVVAQFAKQTPTVGNLVGSEGGEFIFELQPQPLSALSPQLEGKALTLNATLQSLDKEIATKQAELLKLQESVQSEAMKLTELKRSGTPTAPAPAAPIARQPKAYDLDRQGQELFREKKYDEAIEKFKAAVAMKPGDPVLLNNLGFVYYRAGRYDEALAVLLKTLTLDPSRREAHANLGDVYLKLGQKAEAKQHYQQYLDLHPTDKGAAEIRRILATLD
jgi:peptidoglycan/xylan/chitin deacetylase (PgdA/CDA1 family)/Flp pilus assembly protein TadD